MRENLNLLNQKLEKLGLQPSKKQLDQFVSYYEMMVETNKVMNLTSITEPSEVIDKHFVDSLAIVKTDLWKNLDITNLSVIDIGTGAGFPGIPLKIMFPDIKIVLLDSLNKRIKFLQQVADTLQLTDVTCIHGRSEDFARKEEYREQFDLCVSRAVANLSSLSELCLPFVKVGGDFVSYKAGNSQDEIKTAMNAIRKLGGNARNVTEIILPDTDLERVFVEIKKEKHTPKQYPRKAGVPGKEPLG